MKQEYEKPELIIYEDLSDITGGEHQRINLSIRFCFLSGAQGMEVKSGH
jgi:hypothetical protein